MKQRVANPGPLPALLALLLALGGRAGAQIPAAPAAQPLVLGLGAAVRLALEASPSLEGAEAALEAAEARRDAASRLRWPSALASASYSHAGPVDPGILAIDLGAPAGVKSVTLPEALQDSTSFRIALQQPLYTGGRLSSGIAQADAAKEAALAEAAARRRDIAAAAERAWWGLVLAAESEAAVAENLLAVRSHRADAERRLAEGAATKSELLSWRMQEVEASVRARAADADRAAARARLNVLLGRPWDAPLEAAEEPAKAGAAHLAAAADSAAATDAGAGEASRPGLSFREAGLVAAALASRPELAAARARVEAREAAVGVARSALLPSLHLTASAAYADPNPKAFPQRPGFELLWDVGLVASLDLGRLPLARSQVEEARAQAREARGALAQAQDGVALELALAGLELEKARDRLESSFAAVALAEENRRAQEERFAAGIALASELADAESALLQARLDGTRSRVAWELARAALRDAAGGAASGAAPAEAAPVPGSGTR